MALGQNDKTPCGALPEGLKLTRYLIIPADIETLYGEIMTSDRARRYHLADIREHFGLKPRQRPTVWQLAEYENMSIGQLAAALGIIGK